MDLETFAVLQRFSESVRDPRHLIEIHRELNPSRGRRFREGALNRSVVVLVVAAWQALVQDLAERGLAALDPPTGRPRQEYNLVKATTLNAIKNFSTPNAQNTRDLLMRVGCDPRSHWTWRHRGTIVRPTTVEQELDGWLKVRHAIAHGDAALPTVSVLTQAANGRSTLRRRDCERGITFMERLANATATALSAAIV